MGGASGQGDQAGTGGAPLDPRPTFVHPEGAYKFHIDCSAEVSADGSSWDLAMNHPAEALKFVESGDSLLLKRGQCFPQFEGQVLFDIPPGMTLYVEGGFTGDERDLVLEDEDFTTISADFLQNDFGSPWGFQTEVRVSRADNSERIFNLAPGADVSVSNLRLHSAASYEASSYDFSQPRAAIVVGAGAQLFLRRSELAFNASGFAAAVFAGRGSRVFVERTRIGDNYAADHGSIFRAENAEISWEAGLGFYGNRMVRGSSLDLHNSLVSLFDMAFEGNETTGSGAAVRASGALGLLSVDDVRFVDNVADSGAAIAVRGARAQIYNSGFLRNAAAGDGSAIYAEEGAGVLLHNSSFTQNSATASGTIFVQDSQAELFGLRLLWNQGFLSAGVVAKNSELEVSETVLGSNRTSGYDDSGAGTFVSEGGELHMTDTLIVRSTSGFAPTVHVHGRAHLERVGFMDNSGSLALRWMNGEGALVDSFIQRQRSSGNATLKIENAVVNVVGVSFDDSAGANGEGVPEFFVGDASQLFISNTAIWSSYRAGAPLAQVNAGSGVSFVGSCAAALLESWVPAALLSVDPFVDLNHVGPLLKDGSPCVDAGDSLYESAYERSPTKRTATESLALDQNGILDAGLHVERDHPVAASFELRPRVGTWSAGPYPNHCWLYVQNDYWFPRMSGTEGQVSSIQKPFDVGAEAYLVCVDLGGHRMPIALRTEVLPEE